MVRQGSRCRERTATRVPTFEYPTHLVEHNGSEQSDYEMERYFHRLDDWRGIDCSENEPERGDSLENPDEMVLITRVVL